jgi:hypothetical protein
LLQITVCGANHPHIEVDSICFRRAGAALDGIGAYFAADIPVW